MDWTSPDSHTHAAVTILGPWARGMFSDMDPSFGLVLRSTLGWFALIALACDTPRPPTPPSDGGARRDAQAVDAGSTPDADMHEVDSGRDGGMASCNVEVFTLGTDAPPRPRDVGLAIQGTDAAAVWSAGIGALDEVHFAEIPAEDFVITSRPITSIGAVTRDPAIAAVGDGWLIAWYSNAGLDFDVYAMTLRGRDMGAIVPLTTRMGRDDTPTLLSTAEGALAAWVEERSGASRVAVARSLGADATPSAPTRDASPSTSSISRPVLAIRSGGFVLAWVDSASATPSALLQPLDSGGAALGTPLPVSTENNADGTIDLAMNTSGGAAAFGVLVETRPEVRARAIDGSGQPTGPERVITRAPTAGRDASLDFFAGGYAVAYRAVDRPNAQLEIALVTATLDVVGTIAVTGVAQSGGRISLRTTHDGSLVLAWADVDEETTTMRAARVRCE